VGIVLPVGIVQLIVGASVLPDIATAVFGNGVVVTASAFVKAVALVGEVLALLAVMVHWPVSPTGTPVTN
jgi:uncharacterized membrane protein